MQRQITAKLAYVCIGFLLAFAVVFWKSRLVAAPHRLRLPRPSELARANFVSIENEEWPLVDYFSDATADVENAKKLVTSGLTNDQSADAAGPHRAAIRLYRISEGELDQLCVLHFDPSLLHDNTYKPEFASLVDSILAKNVSFDAVLMRMQRK